MFVISIILHYYIYKQNGGQGALLGMTAGATVCTVGTIDIRNKALNAQQWSEILTVIRTAPRPLRLTVSNVPVADASVTAVQRQSSSSSQLNTAATAAVATTDTAATVSGTDGNISDESVSDTSTDDDSHGDSSSELQQHKHEFAQRELSQLLSQLQFPTANSNSSGIGSSPTITRQASISLLADGNRSLVKKGPAKVITV
jgi:hypothetical protein